MTKRRTQMTPHEIHRARSLFIENGWDTNRIAFHFGVPEYVVYNELHRLRESLRLERLAS
jgi:hypothetical protein